MPTRPRSLGLARPLHLVAFIISAMVTASLRKLKARSRQSDNFILISERVRIMSQGQPRRDIGEGWEQDTGRRSGTAAGGHVATWTDKVTMGEALEAAARTAGDRPVQHHDAIAIAAAEKTTTGMNVVVPGGLADAARVAADANTMVRGEEYKTKIGDVLGDAVTRIPVDKAVTRNDAARVARAEIRTNPDLDKRPGGVADSVAAAARLNERSYY